MPGSKHVMVDWQDGTRSGVVVGPWPGPELLAKYLALGIQPSQLEGMVYVEYDDIGGRVTPAPEIREPLASPELEATHRAGYERGLRVGRAAGADEARAAMAAEKAAKKAGGWLHRLFRRGGRDARTAA